MTRRKILVLSIILLMVLGILGGCTQAAPEKTPGTETAMPDTTGVPGEKVTLTFGSVKDYPADWLETDTVQKMMADLNIDIKHTYYDADKFSLMLAGGNLPDLVHGAQTYLPEILDNGLALNLDPLLEEYVPNMLLSIYDTKNALIRELMGGEEKELYFFAPGQGPESVNCGKTTVRGYVVRWDLYKELGYPEIKSDDDYIDVLQDMVDLYPTTEDGYSVYGTGLFDSFRYWLFTGAWDGDQYYNTWTFNGYLYASDIEDNVLYDGYTDIDHSAYWDSMDFYRKVYAAGLLDPDSFTMTVDEFRERVSRSQYVGVTGGTASYMNVFNAAVSKENPDTLVGMEVIPSKYQAVFANRSGYTGNSPTDYVFISSDSENWERALAFLNYASDPDTLRMFYSGIQGETWDYDEEGKPYLFEETLALRASGGEEWDKLGIGTTNTYCNFYLSSLGNGIHPDGYKYDLFEEDVNRALGLTALEEDYCAHYGVGYPGQAVYKLVEEGLAVDWSKDYGQTISAGVTEIPNDIQRIMGDCNDILYRALPKLVMAESDEEFTAVQTQVFDDLEAAGEASAWEWISNAYNASKETVDSIVQAD